jgi:rhodanese-related sulfurtransferase
VTGWHDTGMSAPEPEMVRTLPEIARDEVQRRLDDPSFALVDVLPAASFTSGHIPGAISLPLADVQARARQALPDLLQEIVVYCGGPT